MKMEHRWQTKKMGLVERGPERLRKTPESLETKDVHPAIRMSAEPTE